MTRVLTALVLLPCALALIFFAPSTLFRVVIALLGLGCLHEYLALASLNTRPVWVWFAMGFAALWLLRLGDGVELAVCLVVLVALACNVFWRGRSVLKFPAIAVVFVGVGYIAGPLELGIRLREMNPHWVVFAVLVNAAGDIAALYVGKAVGKHLLAPIISPKKTWEGTLASVVGAAIVGTLYSSRFLATEIGLLHAASLALIVNVVAQLGDLVESGLKRAAGVKDSGNLLPGHGGLLDRLDGLLYSLPVVYGYAAYLALS